ncbi:MAG: ribose-5-phosphate isomerase RpiA [Williamsia sp.]|nr:ribose-5-phosphate isomerase RpiA [Williamsia sp.]
MNTRKLAADAAVDHVKNGMTVGLGTGTTAYWAIQEIGRRVADGLQIRAVATSVQSENLAHELRIPIVPISSIDSFDITIDGADEIDDQLNVIKGGGGALLREKIIGAATKFYIIIADEKKYVTQLGAFPLPVEVVKFGWELVFYKLQSFGCTPVLRTLEEQPYLTDNDHYIIDCSFFHIPDPQQLHDQINRIPGVVENGLFLSMADLVILGKGNGSTEVLHKKSS